jgi:hypothetical protein
VIVKLTSPLHINVSIAMIRALNDAMRVVKDIDDKKREVSWPTWDTDLCGSVDPIIINTSS